MSGSAETGLIDALEAWRASLSGPARALAAAVLDGELPCFVLGRNPHSAFIAQHLPLAGVIDDFAAQTPHWHGLPVLPGHDLPAGAAVINAVLHRRPHQALERLASLPAQPQVLHYADLTRQAPQRCPPLPFCAEAEAVLRGHESAFSALLERFADADSRRTCRDVLLYRLTGDPSFTAGYRLRDPEQYFDLPLGLPAAPVFVDGGAYRGETTELFCRHYPDYAGVHLFEPNPGSMTAARARLADHRDVAFHPNALGERRQRLAFDASAANASRIAAEGGEEVEVVALDETIERADFIKFDLEGFEPKALAGSRRLIRDHHPALAICVYHHPKDFIDVPEQVLSVQGDYQLRLRHYTEGWEETVIYFTRA
ncbi:FkbM family methyltransferase [Endothiovibrio diazotrophicus]